MFFVHFKEVEMFKLDICTCEGLDEFCDLCGGTGVSDIDISLAREMDDEVNDLDYDFDYASLTD